MGETPIGPDELELAVSGLAGLVGGLLMPALGAWLRVLLQWIESDRSGLGKQPRLSGMQLFRAVFNTFALFFFFVALGRAAAELREVRVEAPVFAAIVTGVIVGVVIWAIYAAGLSALKADYQRAKQTRRIR
ncbi:hypothetical protein G6O69_09030 [Pseudenhygromyxa sp. WMMC2535]|uniref:hypothetical protein n=1 Tax=Pseudenhygromyxa sp. WMMC2535 TaxID=2712867 RepID=UPI00155457DD|nr:hypothetical protein [Pseudenhygromyxa sp. WMMC2535]NVB37975.1 hypothetical protein [Pseudenhygromyxa sp. WMMC2535]